MPTRKQIINQLIKRGIRPTKENINRESRKIFGHLRNLRKRKG